MSDEHVEPEAPREQAPEPASEGTAAACGPADGEPTEGSAPGEAPPGSGEVQAAPTDFRRNIWILVVILGVVVGAWLIHRVSRQVRQTSDEMEKVLAGAASGPESQPDMRTPPPQQPDRRPVSYKDLAEAQRDSAKLAVHAVIGDARRYVLASPPYRRPGETEFHPPRLFDVTRTAPGFDTQDLVHLPDVYADQFPLLGQSPEAKPRFAPAKDVDFLEDEERVIVVSEGEDVRAYPLRVLNLHTAIRDELRGTPVLVCWSFVSQSARCFVVPEQDTEDSWGNAGKFYRGHAALYDRATGSLWDTFSGMALTGPKAGLALGRLPATVHVWAEWGARNPEAWVLTMETGYDALRERGTYAAAATAVAEYLRQPTLMLPVPGYDPEADAGPPPKTFVIGLVAGGKTKAYPLTRLSEERDSTLEDQLGDEKITIAATSPRSAYATNAEGQLLDAPVMLWFAWKSAHPNTELWSPQAGPQPE